MRSTVLAPVDGGSITPRPSDETLHDTVTATWPPGRKSETSTHTCGDEHEDGSTSIACPTSSAAPIAAAAERSCAAACAADSAALCTVARLSTPRPRNTITTAKPMAAGVSSASPSASDDP